ncbi:MAG: hypothetical protein ABEK04_06270, partial [Candidatus Nanohalobium sp.]
MKGQSRYLVGVAIMAFAVAFYSLNSFAVEYVLSNALKDMDQNFDRYESAVHSYTVVNDGVNQTSNVINQTRLGNDITKVFSDYDDLCRSSRGIQHPDNYKI